jgi:hypothetical protein
MDLIELNLSNGAEGGSIGVVYDVANKNQQFQLYDAASDNAILVVTDRTSIVCPNTESSGTYFPVFIQNPNAGTSAILSRTASQLKGDIGLANVSVSGHSHSSSDITNFNSSVSGLLPVGTANYLSKFGTGGSGLSNSLVFDNGTNVGIGTTTPSTLLEISKDGGGVDLAFVRIANTNATGGTSLNISRTGPQRAAQIIYQSGTTNQFYQGILRDGGSTTNGWSVSAGADLNVTAPAIHVTSGNYVGIGTKSPQVLLHVNGQAYLQSLNLTGGTADRILATDTNKNVTYLNTSTYPTLTELSYVKGATSSIQTQLDTKAPLSSPAFTGTPTAPTASSGTNTTQIATTAFVRTEISNLVDSAPGTLDTLNELAAALGDDPNFATTVTNNLAGKANLSGATFTGTISSPSGNFTESVNIASQTASTIAGFDANKNITSLSTATYPSLTELSYVKGATSNIQTQINSKQSTLTNPVTGTGTNGKLSKWSSTSTLTDSILSESSTVINIAGSFNSTLDDSYLSFDANARRIGMTKKGGFTGKFTYGSTSSFAIAQSSSGTIEATNTFTDRLVIDPSGNVGIGTTTPGYKLQVAGSFGATTKSFRIDHPSKSGWNLEYGSLESPYHGVRLTGRGTVVKGVGVVDLPSYLKDLIHDDDTLNIQITNIKHGKTIYLEEIDLKNDQFIVKVDRAKSLGELQFCWTLTGVRKDVDHLVVEKEN